MLHLPRIRDPRRLAQRVQAEFVVGDGVVGVRTGRKRGPDRPLGGAEIFLARGCAAAAGPNERMHAVSADRVRMNEVLR